MAPKSYRARHRTMSANPRTLDEAFEELENEAEECEPLSELDFRSLHSVDWSILNSMGYDYE